MKFAFDERGSDSPFVDTIWHTQSGSSDDGSFTSAAVSNWGMVVTKQNGIATITVRGPETKATPTPVPLDAEIFGIQFKLGTFMPHLPISSLVDGATNLPEVTGQSFWLLGSAWQFPTFENADTFISRMVRNGLLLHEPLVEAALQGEVNDWSIRTVRRRFLQATGLSYKTIQQIERARRAVALLEQGVPILDTVYEAGYFDQPHLTKALKHLMGQTPAQILRLNDPE